MADSLVTTGTSGLGALGKLYFKFHELREDYKTAAFQVQSLNNTLEARCAHVLMKQNQFDNLIESLLANGGVPQHVVELRSKILDELDNEILMTCTAMLQFNKEKRLKVLQKMQFALLEKEVDKMILGYLRLDDKEIDEELDRRGLTAERGFREAKRVDKYTSKRPILLESSVIKAYEAKEIPFHFSCGAKRAHNPHEPMGLCIIDSHTDIPAEGVSFEDIIALALKLHKSLVCFPVRD
ncbi:hypothetical protein QBC45DRAFT_393131 [Copromyces sp. CBS 386.78]|nr:hypothetical protein QBC45DRAFT_393131 [Copromyces sp. CBS 386.78]